MYKNIAIIGSSGTIGSSLTKLVAANYPEATIHALSRHTQNTEIENVTHHKIDYNDEHQLQSCADACCSAYPLDLVVVTVGLLHCNEFLPEKSIKQISAEQMQKYLHINTVLPSLMAKHFVPKLNKQSRSVFAVLSARVGSISDNCLGGWYSYRASKAALNMVTKCIAIETERVNKSAIIAGLHPGTVNSPLSKPFQNNIPKNKVFSPDYATECLHNVIDQLTQEQSGKCFAWDGSEIEP
ncbi:SDR family NAD(P)-dependent oxidoreductase [Vibrio sp. SCSIO 43137]|uniref:SDR family NAD(P)-dependent oxidoreductase n=1 Tax=Vibrio sp. SCSIO 43137 TaxID=3021011 RepID=UPI0023072700|nr:SDR family NAD(P)-dependent oxidoreductase [Vibrio sp. SCSIO 43137]WCE32477.1 SDR family NAD(P)-dependent oxidoreductase [Vibrio sp. SCSIO 43137]